MKIIEALKNLKTIQKRIEKNCLQIKEYCAYVSTETPPFETLEKQTSEVNSLVQANMDLEKEYLRLKKAIELTNLNVTVTIGERTYTITELISIKRVVSKLHLATYQSLNPAMAIAKLQQVFARNVQVDASNPPKIVVTFKEEERNKSIREWEEFVEKIDGKLEVVNAETDLQE